MITGKKQLELERLIDHTSVSQILRSIADICHEKAEHVRTSYCDEGLAMEWGYKGNQLHILADKLEKLGSEKA